MKKTVCTLLTLMLLVLCLTACGQEEHEHHHDYHFDATLTMEQLEMLQGATLRVFSRMQDRSYALLFEQDCEAACVNWNGHLLAGPDGTHFPYWYIDGSLGEYHVDGVLWNFDTMESVACTWRISLASGEPEVIGCYDAADTAKELDWESYSQADYRYMTYIPAWDESGPMLPLRMWEKGSFIGFSEDPLKNGVDLAVTHIKEDTEYFFNFEIHLTDGSSFCTELMPVVAENHELH